MEQCQRLGVHIVQSIERAPDMGTDIYMAVLTLLVVVAAPSFSHTQHISP
jgi:hypothetical protein